MSARMTTRAMSVSAMSHSSASSNGTPVPGRTTRGDHSRLESTAPTDVAIPSQQNFAYGSGLPELAENLAETETKQTVGNLMGTAVAPLNTLAPNPPSHNTRSRSKTPSVGSAPSKTLKPPRKPRSTRNTNASGAGRPNAPGAVDPPATEASKSFAGEGDLFGAADFTSIARGTASHLSILQEEDTPVEDVPERSVAASRSSERLDGSDHEPVDHFDQWQLRAGDDWQTIHGPPLSENIIFWLQYAFRLLSWVFLCSATVFILGLGLWLSYKGTVGAIEGIRDVNPNHTASYGALNRQGLRKIDVLEAKVEKRLSFVEHGVAWLKGQNLHQRATSTEKEVALLKTQMDSTAAQADLLMKTDSAANAEYAFSSVNFLSHGLGAVVDPYMTSPTAYSPSTFLQRLVTMFLPAGMGLRKPNGPETALQPWSDIGDCWCTPSRTSRAQLVVLLPRTIYPTAITIEHIPKSATLDKNAIPRWLQLWVEIEHVPKRTMIKEMAMKAFKIGSITDGTLTRDFTIIGEWQYDWSAPNHVQTYHLPFDLKALGVPVSKVALRVAMTWAGNDHTCIYRARLAGEPLPEPDPEDRFPQWGGNEHGSFTAR